MPELKDIYSVLRRVPGPGGKDLVSAGMVARVEVSGEKVLVFMRGDPGPEAAAKAKEAILGLDGVSEVEIRVEERSPVKPEVKLGTQDRGPKRIQGVERVIVVTSGKGGVGKSTVAANLAVALAREGLSVGLFDGDVYGPSIPTLMGIGGQDLYAEEGKIIPIEKHGVKVLSLGSLLEAGAPVLWRGPLVHKAYQQLLFDTLWGVLDFLVLDLPPGTGDAQLSVVQLLKVDGGLVVTTPQLLAVEDVHRAVNMLVKTGVPVLGIVETMSYFRCPKCGHTERIFGEGGGRALAERTGVPLLTEIPLQREVVEASDRGVPVVLYAPKSEAAQKFLELARRVKGRLAGDE